jgi:hypothetical protein
MNIGASEELCDPVEGTVYLTEKQDGTYSFELPNFQLLTNGMTMDIGTIVLPEIKMETIHGANFFTANETITIAPGDKEGIDTDLWYGPWLGEIPVNLKTGVVYAGRMYCVIEIDMTAQLGQIIHVTMGNPDATAIERVAAEAEKSNAPVYDLSGRRLQDSAKGILIVNGKKVIVK